MNRADLSRLPAHVRAEVERQLAGKPNHVPDAGEMVGEPKAGMGDCMTVLVGREEAG